MKRMRKEGNKKEINMYLVSELVKFIENDGEIYEGIYQNVVTNLAKKQLQGIESNLFYKVCFKMVLESSEKYSKLSNIDISEFNKQTREAAAKKIVENMIDDGLIENRMNEIIENKKPSKDERKELVTLYLDEIIDFSEYITELENTVENVRKDFETDCSYYIKTRGIKKAFLYWFSGLPSCLSIPYLDNDVEQVLKEKLKYTNKEIDRAKEKNSLLEELGKNIFNVIYQ